MGEARLGAEPVPAGKATGLRGDAVTPGSHPSKGTKGFSYICLVLGSEEVFSRTVPAPAPCCSARNAGAEPGHQPQHPVATTPPTRMFFPVPLAHESGWVPPGWGAQPCSAPAGRAGWTAEPEPTLGFRSRLTQQTVSRLKAHFAYGSILAHLLLAKAFFFFSLALKVAVLEIFKQVSNGYFLERKKKKQPKPTTVAERN